MSNVGNGTNRVQVCELEFNSSARAAEKVKSIMGKVTGVHRVTIPS